MKSQRNLNFSVKALPLLVLFLLYSINASPCSCIGNPNIKKAIHGTNVIFVGVVQKREVYKFYSDWDRYDSISRVKYTFEIQKMYKGKISKGNQILVVHTGFGDGDCGFEFEVGSKYIVYSNYTNRLLPRGEIVPKFLQTNSCTRTNLYKKEEADSIESILSIKNLKNRVRKD